MHPCGRYVLIERKRSCLSARIVNNHFTDHEIRKKYMLSKFILKFIQNYEIQISSNSIYLDEFGSFKIWFGLILIGACDPF